MAKIRQDAEDIDSAPEEDESKTDPTAERAPMSTLTGIKFTAGQTDRRVISAYDLLSLGVEDPKIDEDLVWSKDNSFIVPIASVNAETVDALIALPEFTAV